MPYQAYDSLRLRWQVADSQGVVDVRGPLRGFTLASSALPFPLNSGGPFRYPSRPTITLPSRPVAVRPYKLAGAATSIRRITGRVHSQSSRSSGPCGWARQAWRRGP